MDFWAEQNKAKNRSLRLTLLFVALVLVFSVLVALVIDAIWVEYSLSMADYPEYYVTQVEAQAFSPMRIGGIVLGIAAIVAATSFFAPGALSSGGRAVAESMKGRLIAPQGVDFTERRLLNVVEEMALASGMPVPPVYILEDKDSINAFAAGINSNDAVIGVTRGLLTHLTRDELQAVVAHEFSHILNGDMRLNMRYAKLVFGLFCLSELGRIVMFSMRGGRNRREKGRELLLLVGMICWLAGLLMAFLGRIFQAAVTRQREYLADASSVQFTRSAALASALKKIGGMARESRIDSVSVATYSHFFFCRTGASLFSTHPPLGRRIRKLDPEWDGHFITPAPVGEKDALSPAVRTGLDVRGGHEAVLRSSPLGKSTQASPLAASMASGRLRSPLGVALSVGVAAALQTQADDTAVLNLRPEGEDEALAKLRAASREPLDACYLMTALLLDNDAAVREKQLASIELPEKKAVVAEYGQAIALAPDDVYLPLIELAVPALKMLSHDQYEVFHQTLLHFIHADNHFSFKEWVLYQAIVSLVGAEFTARKKLAKHRGGADAFQEASTVLLTALARLTPDQAQAEQSFHAGLRRMGQPLRPLPEKPDFVRLEWGIGVLRDASQDLRSLFLSAAVQAAGYNGGRSETEVLYLGLLSLCLAEVHGQKF